ncbi:S41 family peptidase [uncultured Kordia sp.]|uniref:S41 family peptidase n=1 Tax=uncultured Kordia sp. TaxID=507699 RepID=UPI00262E7561|nr:S41 family peptidase [uncultured Kordia sp.]
MKKPLLFIACLLFMVSAKAQSVNEKVKIKEFGLIWGFLKYHHPELSAGKKDIDVEFLNHFQQLKDISDRKELNAFFLNWIQSYGEVSNKVKKPKEAYKFTKNLNLDWIENGAFNPALQQTLLALRANVKNCKGHYAKLESLTRFVSFDAEKKLEDFSPKKLAHRMLTLFRFWNVINYYDVNKYLAEENWNDVLENSLDQFLHAHDAKTYDKAKTELIAKLNDSHTFYIGKTYGYPKFKYKAPFQTTYINDTLVITKFWNKELCQKNGVQLGGMITKIEGKTVKEYIKANFKTFYNHAHENALMYRAESIALYQENRNEINIRYTNANNDTSESKTIQLFDRMEVDKQKESLPKQAFYGKKFYEITPKTAYIGLGYLEKNDLKKLLKKAAKYEAVIFDLRKYPQHVELPKLTKWLYPDRSKFIKVLFPTKVPGLGEYDAEAPLNFVSDPFSGGRKNKNYYKGKVILLVNKSTISQAEYISMAIQNSPNCITIGEETLGAVMNITSIPMPEGAAINFTSMGAFYPDGTNVQRKGVKIDYKVTQMASQPERDMMMEKALEILE